MITRDHSASTLRLPVLVTQNTVQDPAFATTNTTTASGTDDTCDGAGDDVDAGSSGGDDDQDDGRHTGLLRSRDRSSGVLLLCQLSSG